MIHIEDRIRESIKSSEQQLFSIRSELVKYHKLHDGRLIPDPRYGNKILELQAQEEAITQRITGLEGALAQAANLGSKIKGCDLRNPFTWLQDKAKLLKRGIEILETDITMLKRKIEENTGIGTRPNVITRSGQFKPASDPIEGWRAQLSEKENQLKELMPQLEQVKKSVDEIQKILQSAVPGG